MRDAIAKVLWRVTKSLYEEEERRRKDAARQERQMSRRSSEEDSEFTLKEAVFYVLPEAWQAAAGTLGIASARTLYYQVRPRIQPYTSKDLDFNYFSQDLLTQYRELHGEIEGLYYEPRGILYEPHSGAEVPLGTREVDAYTFPKWTYNKILYIEKKGLWPVLKAAKLA